MNEELKVIIKKMKVDEVKKRTWNNKTIITMMVH